MAENKNSFILYCDLLHTIDLMPDENAGKLFKHILKYVNDLDPQTDDYITKLSFEPIKQQLKRDLREWEKSLELKSNSGKLGNLKRWHNDLYLQVVENKLTIEDALVIAQGRKTSHTDTSPSHPIAKIAVNVNVNDTVNDNILLFERFWDLYNKKSDRSKCLIKFKKLKQTEIDKIFETLPSYIIATPEIKFRKNPLTYLNGQCWNDEIPPIEEKKEFNILDYCKPTR